MNNELICYRSSEPSFRLVLLHGWGANAEDLIPVAKLLSQINSYHLEIVLLRAPQQHPDGLGLQWYGLFPADWELVPSAIVDLKFRIEKLATPQISLEKTVLMGFSQGGAMAISCGCELPLAGVIGCSAYPHPGWFPPLGSPPVLLTHGKQDEVVPIEASYQIMQTFKVKNQEIELELFQCGHEITQEIILKIQDKLLVWFGS